MFRLTRRSILIDNLVDEAHHLPASQWQEIIDKFKKHAKIVFFTATPTRADKTENYR